MQRNGNKNSLHSFKKPDTYRFSTECLYEVETLVSVYILSKTCGISEEPRQEIPLYGYSHCKLHGRSDFPKEG